MAGLGDHPNIVTIHDVGDDDGQPYIVSQYMAGGAVDGLDLPLSAERTLEIAKDVCRGLAHAHAHDVVHRDLKPGNVWLAADGAAEIGDFGLAVALEQSRLTMHGMLVGTVAYMPPEQALGGEVTPRADLYSLGCMLYEMITGRPPFVSDNPSAVISQHINTPPVAPSWHAETCPLDLEALILRLLAKDPAESAPPAPTRCSRSLERIDPAGKAATHSDSNVLDRLSLGVFVGREQEMERLRKAFDDAVSGHGGLVMLVGEPGIGKTRTTQELETYAKMRGAHGALGPHARVRRRAALLAVAPGRQPVRRRAPGRSADADRPADDARGHQRAVPHLPVAAAGRERHAPARDLATPRSPSSASSTPTRSTCGRSPTRRRSSSPSTTCTGPTSRRCSCCSTSRASSPACAC